MNDTGTDPHSAIAKNLGIIPGAGRGRHLKRALLIGGLIALIAVAVVLWRTLQTPAPVQYKTQTAQRGDLTVTVTATGNLQPTNLVDVGIEVSGTVASIEADFNDKVKRGQVLAKLDTTKLDAQVLKSQASLESAQAQVLQARATVREAANELARLEQVRELSGGKVPSPHDLDAAQAALQRAQASEAQAMAAVSEAQATLDSDRTNVTKAVIRSPINGVVIKRAVDPGQTVAASFQAPVLFTLAEDLAKMTLHVNVAEADVGDVRAGQAATFTVDAYPDRNFPASVMQVRYGSKEVESVITYETVLNVDNSALLLRPGMTATADIVVKKVERALLVPNAALRFTPPSPGKNSGGEKRGLVESLFGRYPQPEKRSGEEEGDKKHRRVWVLRDGQPAAVPVTTGVTDSAMTEVLSGDLKEGAAVITGIASTSQPP